MEKVVGEEDGDYGNEVTVQPKASIDENSGNNFIFSHS